MLKESMLMVLMVLMLMNLTVPSTNVRIGDPRG
jgi:hypothetical protein